jgi:hypothetical protein
MHERVGPDGRELFWADLHKHMTGPGTDHERIGDVVAGACAHLDAVAVLCYPFKWFRKGREGGIREETVGHRPEFEEWWERITDASAAHNDPGTFVTFPAFEWHGDRRQYGDRNVLYREEGAGLVDADDLADLHDALRASDVAAMAIPHHTGYQVGERGADWSALDPEHSPVMEIYSGHGSSEGVGTPVAMADNDDMGPRTSGGTFQDALAAGYSLGVVASNDGPGLPGSWGNGVAGVWAPELTREALWTALRERRTYGTTGDRIALWWELDGHPMGDAVAPGDLEERSASVTVDCPRPLERVELIHDGEVIDVYDHLDRDTESDVRRVLVEFGWGPNAEYGDFSEPRVEWSGTVRRTDGDVRAVAPRFVGDGNEYALEGGACEFELVTVRGEDDDVVLPEGVFGAPHQGLILEVDGTGDLRVELDDCPDVAVPLSTEEATVRAFTVDSAARIEAEFELGPEDIDNRDIVYHNARKVKVHPAAPVTACRASVTFTDLPASEGPDSYYVRARQVDGQCAWGSPVWVDEGNAD